MIVALGAAKGSSPFGAIDPSKEEDMIRQMERERKDHAVKIEQYKEQVKRMRENIDLFKDNLRMVKEQNEELKLAQGRPSPNILELIEGLKEDNARLVEEVRELQDENFQLSTFMGVSKETISQQNSIINNLKEVIEKY
jgi:chromosome segregation ATPase